MNFLKYLFLFFFLLIINEINAQYKVSGFAYDDYNNLLINTEIELSDSNKKVKVLSNAQGYFTFLNVKKGNYKLSLENKIKETYVLLVVKDSNIEIDLFSNDATKQSNLENIEIKVQSVKSEIEKRGFAVNLIETKEAGLRNIQTNELLDRTVGVRVRQSGGLGSSVDYNLNGMSGNAIKIFVDGIPISTYGPSFSLNSIPPALIERIEVYKGVVPIHLSDDALGGAINVILKRGLRNTFNASVSYGSFNTFQTNINGAYRESKNGFTVKASGFHNFSDNDYEVWGKFVRDKNPDGTFTNTRAKRFNDAYRSSGGSVEVGFTDVKWADQFFVGVNISDSYREVQHGTYMTTPYYGRFVESQANVITTNYRKNNFIIDGLRLNINSSISDRSEIVNDTVKWRYNWNGDRAIGFGGNNILTPDGAQQGAPTVLHSDRKIFTLRTDLAYKLHENHQLQFNYMGFAFDRKDRDDMRSSMERELVETRKLNKNILSFAYELRAFESKFKSNLFSKYYMQNLEKIKPVIRLVNGQPIRENILASNKYDYTGYGAALSYAIKPAIVILVSAEKAIRLPVEGEIFGEVGDNVVENNSLTPEISTNTNFGFKIGPYKINDHKFSFGANGFFRDTKDKIVRRSSTRINDAEETAPFENLNKTLSKGFELEFNYSFKKDLHVLVNSSKFNTVYNSKYDNNGTVNRYYNQQLPNEPFFTINANVQYTLHNLIQKESRLNLYYNLSSVDSFYTNWLEVDYFSTPKQLIHDLGLSYIFPNKKFVLSVDAKNILNDEAYDNFALQKPGRSFYVKLNYILNKF